MKPKVGGMYRVVYGKSDGYLSQALPSFVIDGSIVVIEQVLEPIVMVELVMGEMESSVWGPNESFPIHPSVLEEIE